MPWEEEFQGCFLRKPQTTRLTGNKAIRKGGWKLVSQYKSEWELYDLKSDRTETHNLAAQNPEKVKELAALWQQWADDLSGRAIDGGHFFPEEKPEDTASALRDFFAGT